MGIGPTTSAASSTIIIEIFIGGLVVIRQDKLVSAQAGERRVHGNVESYDM